MYDSSSEGDAEEEDDDDHKTTKPTVESQPSLDDCGNFENYDLQFPHKPDKNNELSHNDKRNESEIKGSKAQKSSKNRKNEFRFDRHTEIVVQVDDKEDQLPTVPSLTQDQLQGIPAETITPAGYAAVSNIVERNRKRVEQSRGIIRGAEATVGKCVKRKANIKKQDDIKRNRIHAGSTHLYNYINYYCNLKRSL